MKAQTQKQFTLAELVKDLDVTIKGNPDFIITGVCPIEKAKPGCITFLTNSLYRKHLATTAAGAVILSEKDVVEAPINMIVTRNPHYVYAKIAEFFDDKPKTAAGIHPTAVIGEGADIDSSASIGPYSVIGAHVKIGAQAVVGAQCVVGDFSELGEGCQLDARVTVYHNVRIGKRSRITSGAVIGSDGFGWANQKGTWHKVPQLGGVEIGDDVDVGANTTIDRGAVEDTVIENGVKLDNLIQVAHNVRIGANTVVAGCVGIAGSATIGKNCMIGGASNINGHIKIADNVMITGMTAVTRSIQEPGLYSSGILGAVPNEEFRRNNARFHRLGNLMQRVKDLESAFKALTERNES